MFLIKKCNLFRNRPDFSLKDTISSSLYFLPIYNDIGGIGTLPFSRAELTIRVCFSLTLSKQNSDRF